MKLQALFLFACSLVCLAADRLDVNKVEPAVAGMNLQRLSAIPVRMREFVDAKQTAGIVTIVGRHGKVASFEAVGFRDINSKTPMRKNSLFRVASLTKPITCAGIMVLVDDGRLSVIDPVEKYLPDYKGMKVRSCQGSAAYGCNGVPSSRPINIEDLMAHTSGLETSSEAPSGKEPVDACRTGCSLGKIATPVSARNPVELQQHGLEHSGPRYRSGVKTTLRCFLEGTHLRSITHG